MTPDTAPLRLWVGKAYGEGECWLLVRDAFLAVRGVTLPVDYYAALPRFDTVYRAGDTRPFDPQPWDVVMVRFHPVAILHCALYLGDRQCLESFGETGAGIASIDDARWSGRIAGYLRLAST